MKKLSLTPTIKVAPLQRSASTTGNARQNGSASSEGPTGGAYG